MMAAVVFMIISVVVAFLVIKNHGKRVEKIVVDRRVSELPIVESPIRPMWKKAVFFSKNTGRSIETVAVGELNDGRVALLQPHNHSLPCFFRKAWEIVF
ncbi:MAG: hypothetical protein WC435_03775 [Candidatus Paceibacterota bacterium]